MGYMTVVNLKNNIIYQITDILIYWRKIFKKMYDVLYHKSW